MKENWVPESLGTQKRESLPGTCLTLLSEERTIRLLVMQSGMKPILRNIGKENPETKKIRRY